MYSYWNDELNSDDLFIAASQFWRQGIVMLKTGFNDGLNDSLRDLYRFCDCRSFSDEARNVGACSQIAALFKQFNVKPNDGFVLAHNPIIP